MNNNEVTYTSNYRQDLSIVDTIRLLISDIHGFRGLIWQLMRKEFVSSYRGSFLGILWTFIMPIIPITVYLALQMAGILRGSSEMPRSVYIVCGFLFWHFFAGALTASSVALQKNSAMIKKTKLPLIVVYLSGFGQVFFDFIVRFVLFLGVLFFFGIDFSFGWFLGIPILALPLLFWGFGLGLILSMFAVYMRDLDNLVRIGLRYGLLLSAVIFPIPNHKFLYDFLKFNPILHLVELGRNLIIVNTEISTLQPVFISIGCSVIIVLFALKKLYSVERHLIEGL